jgi:hypothetical protein
MNGLITIQGKDTVNDNLQFYGNAGLTWDITSGGSVGTIQARSAAELASGDVYNATGNLDYGDNKYFLNIVDTTSNFLTNAMGTYGGNQYSWFFTLTESDVVVNDKQVADVTGDIYYAVPAGGLVGSITSQVKDTVNGDLQFYGNLDLRWDIEDGGNVASVSAKSAADVASGAVYNATGIVNYGNNAYFVDFADTTSNFLAEATGAYGGDVYNWFLTVAESTVVVNGDQVASIVAAAYYDVPMGAEEGSISLEITDTVNGNQEFFTNNMLTWNITEDSNLISVEAYSVAALTEDDEVYNARGTFQLNLADKVYALSIADTPNDYMQLYYEMIGGYSLTGDTNNYALTCTYADKLVFTAGGRYKFANHIHVPTPPPAANFTHEVTYAFLSNATLNYVDIGVLPAFRVSDGYIFDASLIENVGLMTDDSFGQTATKVQVVHMEQIDTSADMATWQFMTIQTLYSDSPITASDLNAAFAELSGQVTAAFSAQGAFLNDLHFNAMRAGSLALNAVASANVQVSTTYEIFEAPTRQPTMAPVTSAPSAVPTAMPTSRRPTPAPTFVPTRQPTFPVHTVATFAVNQVVNGATTTDFNLTASVNAFDAAVASTMAGIIPSDVVITTVTGSASRRRLYLRGTATISATPVVHVTYNVTFSAQGTTSSAVMSQYTTLTGQLIAAVSSGNFTKALQSQAGIYGAPLTSATADTVPTISQPTITSVYITPTKAPTSKAHGKLTGGAVAGIVIGSVVVVSVLVGCVYVFYCRRAVASDSSGTAPAATAAANTDAASRTQSSVSPNSPFVNPLRASSATAPGSPTSGSAATRPIPISDTTHVDNPARQSSTASGSPGARRKSSTGYVGKDGGPLAGSAGSIGGIPAPRQPALPAGKQAMDEI